MSESDPYQAAGYTLIEFAMVALLVGLMAAIVLPSDNDSLRQDVDAAAYEVAAALRFAREESIRTSEVHGVSQSTSENRLRVFRIDNLGSLIYDVYHPVSKQLWDIKLNLSPRMRNVVIDRSNTWRDTCNKPTNFAFRSDGTPVCTDPDSALLEQGSLILTQGSLQRVVNLDGYTGRVWLP